MVADGLCCGFADIESARCVRPRIAHDGIAEIDGARVARLDPAYEARGGGDRLGAAEIAGQHGADLAKLRRGGEIVGQGGEIG